MTGMDARMAALEAMAEAARKVSSMLDEPEWGLVTFRLAYSTAREKLSASLAALAALPAQPVGETVEVRAAVVFYSADDWLVRGQAGWDRRDMDAEAQGRGRPLAAIITARVPLTSVPTIPATVEPTP